MKRTRIEIEDIASFHNLSLAAVNAGKGKRDKAVVCRFFGKFYDNINILRNDILSKKVPYNKYKVFTIFDPKKREIYAPGFKDRIIQHALVNFAGPVIDKALVDSTFACRNGKGPLKAALLAQNCTGKFPWFVKVDIKKYFDSIDHQILINLLECKIKGNGCLDLIERIIRAYNTTHGKGLPIGSLTSQHFANYYLDKVDRFVLNQNNIFAYVRYMDDMVWWCKDKEVAKDSLIAVKGFVEEELLLELKENFQINRSVKGLTYCGFRVFANNLGLTKRKKKRFSKRLAKWENAYTDGLISEKKLQSAYSAVHSIISNVSSNEWCKSYFYSRKKLDF